MAVTRSARALRDEPTERVSLVMPISLRGDLLDCAEAESRSLSNTIISLLREALQARENTPA